MPNSVLRFFGCYLLVTAALALTFGSCRKDPSLTPPEPPPSCLAKLYGILTDSLTGKVVPGVNVNGSVTDDSGRYSFTLKYRLNCPDIDISPTKHIRIVAMENGYYGYKWIYESDLIMEDSIRVDLKAIRLGVLHITLLDTVRGDDYLPAIESWSIYSEKNYGALGLHLLDKPTYIDVYPDTDHRFFWYRSHRVITSGCSSIPFSTCTSPENYTASGDTIVQASGGDTTYLRLYY